MFYYYIYLFFIIFLSSFVENIYTKGIYKFIKILNSLISFLLSFFFVFTDCDVHKLFEKCALNETCIESTNQCVCKANFVLDEKIGRCVLNDHLNEDHSPNVIPNHASTPTSSQDGSVSGNSYCLFIYIIRKKSYDHLLL